MATTEPRVMTAQDLWELPPDGLRHELVRGELRTMPPAGWEHGEITGVLAVSLRPHVVDNELGRVSFGDIGFKLAQRPDTVRAPDAAFISRERLALTQRITGYSTIVPDLVIEIISPSDRYTDVAEKVSEWLDHGVRVVVLIDSRRRVVSVHRHGQPVRELRESDVLDGEDIVPGWRLPVSDIFAVVPRE